MKIGHKVPFPYPDKMQKTEFQNYDFYENAYGYENAYAAHLGFSMFVAPNLRGLKAKDHEIWHVGLISANLKYGSIRILIFSLGGAAGATRETAAKPPRARRRRVAAKPKGAAKMRGEAAYRAPQAQRACRVRDAAKPRSRKAR